ncbi:hypothetical protein GIB67_002625, partial [Kingdonia uniflora]
MDILSLPHVFPLNNDVRGPEKTSVDLTSLCISETNTGALKQSPSPKLDTLDDATLEHQSNLVISVPNEVHADSSEPLASKEDNQNALNGPRAAATDLLPRGIIEGSLSCNKTNKNGRGYAKPWSEWDNGKIKILEWNEGCQPLEPNEPKLMSHL